jgi:hypothetical protein
MSSPRLLAGLGLALSLGSAHALMISNAAYAGAFVRDCRSAAAAAAGSLVPDKCVETSSDAATGFSGTLKQQAENASFGGYTAAVAATNPLGIVGSNASGSTVDASGAAGTLVLKQGAFSSTGYARVSGQSVALQSFYFDGSGPAVRTVSGALDFTASNLMSQADFNADINAPGNLIQGGITVFSLTAATFDYTPGGGVPFFDATAFDTGAGYRDEASIFVNEVLGSPYSVSVTFTPEVGRYYFIQSRLGLWAKFGATLDATHTFKTTLGVTDTTTGVFTPTTEGFTAAAALPNPEGIPGAPVPEPATWLLALGGLAVVLQRRQRAR